MIECRTKICQIHIQNKVNLFREVKKLEVRRFSKEMRSLIERKEESMIQELETIWKELNVKLVKKKTETEKIFKKLKQGGKKLKNYSKK